MIRINPSKNGVVYHSKALSKEEGYLDREIVGTFHGKLTEKLGLSKEQEVDKDAFKNLCEGKHPLTEQYLNPYIKNRKDRRNGFDFTFSAKKSVSVLYGITGDERILEAFRKSVAYTMGKMEEEAHARVRKSGQNQDRKTENWIWAEYIHTLARPTSKNTVDPHLHCHAYVMNLTFDKKEEMFKALQASYIKEKAHHYWTPIFDAYFAKILNNELGYTVKKHGNSFEIAGFTKEMCEKYSKRTKEINKEAEEREKKKGKLSEKEKAQLGKYTRKHKDILNISQEDLKKQWINRLSKEEKLIFREIAKAESNILKMDTEKIAKAAVEYGISALSERSSVFGEKELIAKSLQFGLGYVDDNDITKEIQKRKKDFVIKNANDDILLGLRTLKKKEDEIVSLIQDGRGRYAPIKSGEHQFQPITDTEGKQHELSSEQKNAVDFAFQSMDFCCIIEGKSGAGKSTAVSEIVRGIQSTKKEIFLFAPSNQAKNVLLEDNLEAQTLWQLLNKQEIQKKIKNNYVLVDEYSQISTKDLHQLLSISKEQNARIIFCGDANQNKSVEAGNTPRLLREHGGVNYIEISEIQRQKSNPEYLKVAEVFNKGVDEKNVDNVFNKLQKMGSIVEKKSEEKRLKALAKEYVSVTSSKDKRGQYKSCVVNTPSHKERKKIISAIREELQAKEKIGTENKTYSILEQKDLTTPDKKLPQSYSVGDTVIFNQKAKSNIARYAFERGARLQVSGFNEKGQVLAKNERGTEFTLPLKSAQHFSVYSQRQIQLSVGDKIITTRSEFARATTEKARLPSQIRSKKEKGKAVEFRHFLKRDAQNEITGFTKDGGIKLKNGYTINNSFGGVGIDLAYARTSHIIQGKTGTVDIYSHSKESFGAGSKEGALVGLTRGKEDLRIFTDDLESLKLSILKSQDQSLVRDLEEKSKIPDPKAAQKKRVEELNKRKFSKDTQRKQKSVVKTATSGKEAEAQKHKNIVAPEVNKPVKDTTKKTISQPEKFSKNTTKKTKSESVRSPKIPAKFKETIEFPQNTSEFLKEVIAKGQGQGTMAATTGNFIDKVEKKGNFKDILGQNSEKKSVSIAEKLHTHSKAERMRKQILEKQKKKGKDATLGKIIPDNKRVPVEKVNGNTKQTKPITSSKSEILRKQALVQKTKQIQKGKTHGKGR